MRSINQMQLESNNKIRLDFNGGELSSDSGLFLVNEFCWKLGLNALTAQDFHTTDNALFRIHQDHQNLRQMLLQVWSGYFQDDHADALAHEPVMAAILGKDRLASQPTLSRFFCRMDKNTLTQFTEIQRKLRKRVYSVEKPQQVLFDLDSTLLDAYGKQEGNAFNVHYQACGYHPLLCYDGLTGDLLKGQLRSGTEYCGKGVADFMQPLFEEYASDYPDIPLYLRGDSGFAMPELYKICEEHDCRYVIRLKNNPALQKLASELDNLLLRKTADNMTDHAVVFGEFEYQAESWDKVRRVVCKIEKPAGQFLHTYMFVVTNLSLPLKDVIRLYCQRGVMENYIKEGKNGFDFGAVSSSTMTVNANRLALHILAYNLFNWFRRLVLPEAMRKLRIDALRSMLLKIASRIVRSGRYLWFKLNSSCPFQQEFRQTLQNIQALRI